MPGVGNGNTPAPFDDHTNRNIVQQPPFGAPQLDHLQHMSMPPMNHMPYSMDQSQQTPLAHMNASHTYGGADYSPMNNFSPGPLATQIHSQIYDPQLVTIDPQMRQSEATSSAFAPQASAGSLANHPPDMLQFWLSQADDEFGYAALNFSDAPDGVYEASRESPLLQPLPRPAAASELSDSTSTSNIPNERFARVEACWLSGTGKTQRLGPTLWDDVMASPGPSLFTSPRTSSTPPTLSKSDSRWGIGAELKQRLELEFGMSSSQHSTTSSGQDSFPRPSNLGVPPPEVLDICLDAYFRRFHPLCPFVHIPTFNASAAPLPLLYAMCLLGLSAVKENVGGNYMKHAFKNILRKVLSDVALDATSDPTIARRMSTFAAGCLTLNLAALSGDQDQVMQAQALHACLLSNAQKQGLFSVNEVLLDKHAALMTEESHRWQGWARMETVKRLTVCLLSMDYWFSAYGSTSPAVRPEGIQVCIPADNVLFAADSLTRWEQLLDLNNFRLTFPLLRPRMFDLEGPLDSLTSLDPPLHPFAQHTLLTVIKLAQCDAQHRHFLLTDDWERHDHLIPWHSFSEDLRARALVPVTIRLASIVTARPSITDSNAMVLWHNLCMTLNCNVQIFELAAGRGGAGPASKALADITEWTQTSSARRTCVHAAQIFKLLHNRKVSDPIGINALTALFYAALVLGLYLFVVPPKPEDAVNNAYTYDVLDDVDWTLVGDAGMTIDSSPESSPGAGFEKTTSSVPAVAFIERGGPMSIGGVVSAGGYMSARRTFLDFAHLMDEMGTWKPKMLSKILHIMSDVLEG